MAGERGEDEVPFWGKNFYFALNGEDNTVMGPN